MREAALRPDTERLRARAYRPGDESLFLDLLTASLRGEGAEAYSADFWRWKHLDNPFGPSYGRFVWDEEAGRAAALRVLMRWSFRLPSGDRVAAARAVDTATHADYRRSGLFRRLTEAAVADLSAEGCGFIFNTPNAKSLPGYLAMGWRTVAGWPVYVRVRRPLACAVSALGRSASAPLSEPAWEGCFGPAVEPWEDFESHWGDRIAEAVEAWEAARPQVGLRTPRDAAYLRWRYGRHPAVRYGVLAAANRGALEGFAVLRPNCRAGLREVVIAEVFVRPGSRAAGERLLRRVAGESRADYCVASFAAGSAELRMLRGALFLRVPGRGITLAARRLNPTPGDPLHARGWDISLGDLEVF